jgi:WD40 repeat protein
MNHISPDGGSHRHRVWSLSRGELVLDLPTDRPGARLAFSPDSLRLAAGGPGHVLIIYDLGTLREVRRLRRIPNLAVVAFHPLGRLLAITGAVDRAVEVRDVDTGAVAVTLAHPRGWGYGLAWSGDGATLAASSEDG